MAQRIPKPVHMLKLEIVRNVFPPINGVKCESIFCLVQGNYETYNDPSQEMDSHS